MIIRNSSFVWVFVLISTGTLTAPTMGFNLYAWAFQGYHVISVSPLRSQNRWGFMICLSLSFFLCKVQRMPLQSLSKHVVRM